MTDLERAITKLRYMASVCPKIAMPGTEVIALMEALGTWKEAIQGESVVDADEDVFQALDALVKAILA